MSVSVQDRTIKVIEYRQEPDDQGYGSCLWATFIIDAVRRSLCIQSDGGNMQHIWGNIGDGIVQNVDATPHERFYSFLAKLDSDYLLCKLSNKTRFNFDATVEKLASFVEDSHPALAKRVRELEPCSNETQFAMDYMDLPGAHSDDLECIVMDYPRGHQNVVGIFCQYAQPLLRQPATLEQVTTPR